MAKHLENYDMVKERLPIFWERYPDGRITTDIISRTESSCCIKAYLYRDHETDKELVTGIAEEHKGVGGPANKECWTENCETSAIGRALANLNMKVSDKRPSQEEMQKVERHDGANPRGNASDEIEF